MKFNVNDLVKLKDNVNDKIYKNLKNRILTIRNINTNNKTYGINGYYFKEDLLVPYIKGQDCYNDLKKFIKSGIFGNFRDCIDYEDRLFVICDINYNLVMVYQDGGFDYVKTYLTIRDNGYISALYDDKIKSFDGCNDNNLVWSCDPYMTITTKEEKENYIKLNDIDKMINERYGFLANAILTDVCKLEKYKF